VKEKSMDGFVLALDQGTTTSRAILYDATGRQVSMAQKAFRQHYPRPGWVEHDPLEIWTSQLAAAREAVEASGVAPGKIAAIGIANQRETAVFWDRKTGEPLGPAIVWQDRRTADICRRLDAEGLGPVVAERTGLLLDPYFSGTKIAWFLGADPGIAARASRGEVAFGTVDSWLIFKLTGRHLTDPSNASRTMLFDIKKGRWDDGLAKALGVPTAMLPEVAPSASRFGDARADFLGVPVPVCGDLGDQQAALLGQACLEPGSVKATYGTGCFCLLNTGRTAVPSRNRLLTTVAWDLGSGLEYALEGSVFIAGAVVQWLRDELKVLASSAESAAMARAVPDTAGVYFVPAFAGLGAPWWDPDARGAILGITRGTRQEHVVRAALEAIAYQARDLMEAMKKDADRPITGVRVDGGASTNDFLMQFQADVLSMPLARPRSPETTALGAAFAAGLAAGVWSSRDDLARMCEEERRFEPRMDPATRERLTAGWARAVAAVRTFGAPAPG
jgi:glycerol kinase